MPAVLSTVALQKRKRCAPIGPVGLPLRFFGFLDILAVLIIGQSTGVLLA
jgi:hypothetical protein